MLNTSRNLAQRVQAISESMTIRIFSLARQLHEQGDDIISLAVGEPDFDTPEPVITATRKALSDQATRYGPVAGIDPLRSRLARAFHGYGPENIVITNGAKQALFSLFQILCNSGDEVIIPRPCWVSFSEQIKLAGGRPVLVDTVNHRLDPLAVRRALTPHTRAILVNTPNNPTGAVYSAEALVAVAGIAEEHDLYLIADEAYHAYTFDDRPHVCLLDLAPCKERIIIVRSFSKQYNMTGFRVGYVAANESIVKALAKLQSHASGNVCTFAQYGALAALEMDQAIVEDRRKILELRCNMAFDEARKLFECIRPQGAFYLFPDVSRYLSKNETSEDLAMRLLKEAGVAVVPGEAFGGPGHIRISFGTGRQDLRRAFERIKKVL